MVAGRSAKKVVKRLKSPSCLGHTNLSKLAKRKLKSRAMCSFTQKRRRLTSCVAPRKKSSMMSDSPEVVRSSIKIDTGEVNDQKVMEVEINIRKPSKLPHMVC